MAKTRTFREYRTIDLCFFAFILVVSETLVSKAANFWFPQELYSVSVVPAVVALVIMRWGVFAGLFAVLGGFVTCKCAGADIIQYLIYAAGNVLSLAAVLLTYKDKGRKIRSNAVLSVLFAVAVALLMQTGRSLVALALGLSPAVCINFITTDVLSSLMACVVIYIARRLDGIFEDQKSYVLRINKPESAIHGED